MYTSPFFSTVIATSFSFSFFSVPSRVFLYFLSCFYHVFILISDLFLCLTIFNIAMIFMVVLRLVVLFVFWLRSYLLSKLHFFYISIYVWNSNLVPISIPLFWFISFHSNIYISMFFIFSPSSVFILTIIVILTLVIVLIFTVLFGSIFTWL